MVDDQEILSKIQTCVSNALGVEEEEVEPDKVLSRDLGAESIDYLDITFQIEKAFGISIQKDELFPQKIFRDENLVRDGVVTPEGLTFLEQQLPYADLTEFRKDPQMSRVSELFTVGLLVNYVKTKLAA
ncbi:MAG: phosphopantetheine-binding protein [Planctomycetota bacterium]|nr:phosphopantetheine-binding protein [Planctomycetota bacterium]